MFIARLSRALFKLICKASYELLPLLLPHLTAPDAASQSLLVLSKLLAGNASVQPRCCWTGD